MANKAVNVFLNAYDNTAGPTSSAAANVAGYADSVVSSNYYAADSFAVVGRAAEEGVVSSLIGIVAAALPVIAVAGAVAAAGYLVYQNWEAISSAIGNVVSGTTNWRGVFVDAAEIAVTGLAAIEGGFKMWGEMASYVGLGAAYQVIKFANIVEYYFTEVIPTYVDWVSENWASAFTNLEIFIATVITNMADNIQKFLLVVAVWLSGGSMSFKWTSLTEGFEASLAELPVIAERQLGDLEKQMGTDLDIIGKNLADGVQDNINKRLGQLQGAFGGKGAGGAFDAAKDFIANFKLPSFGGAGGGRSGGSQQVTQPEGESSRFLTGSSAAAAERIALEQLALQRQMAQTAKEQAETQKGIGYLLRGDISGFLRQLAVKEGTAIILAD